VPLFSPRQRTKRELHPEHRNNRRRAVRDGARIAFSVGSGLVNRQIADVSGVGTRLEVKSAESLPHCFTLSLSHDGQLRRQRSIVSRSRTAVGVEFIAGGPSKSEKFGPR
jgi:hypothetical protein